MIFDFLGFFGRRNFPPDLRSSDLPSKRLLGKGLASIGYETEWKGLRYARIDFVAVPSDIFRREAGALLKLPEHENVVKTHGLTVDRLSCSLVLDYMDDKLTDLLQKRKDVRERSPAGEHDLTLQESLGWILQIARAVEHLHKHDVIHGDLKSRNILVTYMNDGDKSLSVKTVKVADFGLVHTKRCSMSYVSHRARKLDMVRWKAPEILREATALDPDTDTDEDFTGSACATPNDDAYCFGLTCFQILTGEEPYPKRNWKELVTDIVSNKRGLKLPPNLSCPQELRELVDVCCDADPDKRPTFSYIRETMEHIHSRHPWIVKEELKQLEIVSEPMEPIPEALRMLEDLTKYESKYTDSKESRPSGLSWPEDLEAFREIHAELDMLKSQFQFDDFPYASESMSGDGDEDKQDLPGNLGQTATVLPANVEKMKVVVDEKIEGRATDDDLPSYLNIDPASVKIKDPVLKLARLRSHDDEKISDGWALVRSGTYLGCEYALKVFNSGDTTWNRRELLKEVRSLMKLHHPHVVQVMGFAQDEEKCIILLELMDNDLRHFMKPRSRDGKRPFARSEELDIITQIAKGMYYVHEQQYVHGELKCSNILVKQIGDAIDVKISDFRSSQKLGVWDPALFRERSSRMRPRWTAPEVTSYKESSEPTHELLKKTDVYSFGMVCFEVVTGKLPFQDIRGEVLERRIASGELKQDLPRELDEKLKVLIESCWERDPDLRPSFEAICHRLDHIRSSQHALPKLHSGVSTVKGRLIPLKFNSGEHTVEQQVDMDLEGPTSVASRQIARTDLGDLKKETSQKHTECTQEEGESDGEDGADEDRDEELDSAKAGASVVTKSPSIGVLSRGLEEETPVQKAYFMEYISGGDLLSLIVEKKRLQDRRLPMPPFPAHDTLDILLQIASAVKHMHQKGVVHCDLKSENVIISNTARYLVKVADFGSARECGTRPFIAGPGTKCYAAPESLQQLKDKSIVIDDPNKIDVYSFGVVAFELLTGDIYFKLCEKLKLSMDNFRARVIDDRAFRPPLRQVFLHIQRSRGRIIESLGSERQFVERYWHMQQEDLILFVERCWSRDPAERPSFCDICEVLDEVTLRFLSDRR